MVDDSYYTRNSKKKKEQNKVDLIESESIFICPVCLDSMRKILAKDETEESYVIDFCTGCAGVWLDKGELQKAVKAKKGIPAKVLNLAPYKEQSEWLPEGQRKCPKCRQLLEVKKIKDVNIDFCTECGGLLLNQNELYDLVCGTEISTGKYKHVPSNWVPEKSYTDDAYIRGGLAGLAVSVLIDTLFD